jgi:hypothetical protein
MEVVMRYRSAVILGLAVACFHLHVFAQQVNAGQVSVASAKRGNVFTSFSGQQLRPTNPTEDVVLLLEVAGLTPDQFQKIDRDKVYVLAGERKWVPGVASSGVIDGRPEIKLGIIVPKNVLDLQLVVGDFRPVKFKAPAQIVEELK